jgi:uncharacterized LabA/DUF88 family protein
MDKRGKSIYAFVDAANLFYGGEKSLRWRIDYERLLAYLREKLSVTKVFYYAGIDVEAYKEEGKEINLEKLVKYFSEKTLEKGKTEAETITLGRQLERAKFYRDLKKFGYELRIKPTKTFTSAEGTTTTKANCDVDLTFDMMRYMSQYNEAVVLSGDGDFAPIVEYLVKKHKKISVLARSERTAREMRELAGENFVDFKSIRKEIEAVGLKIEKVGEVKERGDRASGVGNRVMVKKIPVFRKGF